MASNKKEYYYKITSEDETEKFYLTANMYIQPEKVCEVLGFDGFIAIEITKEEYEENTGD